MIGQMHDEIKTEVSEEGRKLERTNAAQFIDLL